MSPFEVPDGPYTIDGVMDEIHRQVIAPAAASANPAAANSTPAAAEPALPAPAAVPPLSLPRIHDGSDRGRLNAALAEAARDAPLAVPFRIRSHRPVVGRLLDLLKRVIHWGASPYTDLIRDRQAAVNRALIDALSAAAARLGALEREVALLRPLADRTAADTATLFSRDDISPLFDGVPPADRLDLMLATRGSIHEIAGRQRVYLDLFRNAPGQILDLGCGRGEFLNLLRLEGIECWGADFDPLMVETTRALGVHAIQADALAALASVPDASLGGLFAAQVVEHLHPGDLARLLRLARAKLARGATLVLETVNASSPAALTKNWTRDIDHKRAIHPDALRLLVGLAGFDPVEMRLLAPFGPDERLAPPPADLDLPDATRAALSGLVDSLNASIFGMQDYAVIAIQAEPRPFDDPLQTPPAA